MSFHTFGRHTQLYPNPSYETIYIKTTIVIITFPTYQFRLRDNIVTIRADFQQGMESVFRKMNAVTENYWPIYAAAAVTLSFRILFSVTESV